jgi:hypothetical protein
MPSLYNRLTLKKRKDILVLANFVNVYCRENHKKTAKQTFYVADEDLKVRLRDLNLCPDCSRLLEHGIAKLSLCPYDPRPSCRKCETHCYAPGYRDKVRQVMRFSGTYLIKHGRLDLLWHYLT